MCVVQIGRFRGQIEVEEAAFFVRGFDPPSGRIQLSDRSEELLAPEPGRLGAAQGPEGAVVLVVGVAQRGGEALGEAFDAYRDTSVINC